jgi:hypothetical protein
MKDYFIRNTSGDLLKIINTDLEKLEKVNEMYEALKAISRDIQEWHEVKAKAYLKMESILKQLEK